MAIYLVKERKLVKSVRLQVSWKYGVIMVETTYIEEEKKGRSKRWYNNKMI